MAAVSFDEWWSINGRKEWDNTMAKAEIIGAGQDKGGIVPPKKYSIIYADPPWLYKCGKNHLARASMINGKDDFHYPAMSLDEIKRMNIQSISEENCLVFMWVTSPFLKYGIDTLCSWGFAYSTVAFVWYKQKPNPGSYTLSECELCIVGKRGKIPKPRGKRNIRQFLSEMRETHSKKPDEIRNRIFSMFPTLNKIELFARQRVEGWDAWGNEIEESPVLCEESPALDTKEICHTAPNSRVTFAQPKLRSVTSAVRQTLAKITGESKL